MRRAHPKLVPKLVLWLGTYYLLSSSSQGTERGQGESPTRSFFVSLFFPLERMQNRFVDPPCSQPYRTGSRHNYHQRYLHTFCPFLASFFLPGFSLCLAIDLVIFPKHVNCSRSRKPEARFASVMAAAHCDPNVWRYVRALPRVIVSARRYSFLLLYFFFYR